MRKVLACFLTLAMLFTLVIPSSAYARAEQKIKLSDAIEASKKILDINTDNYNFNYNYNENRDGLSTWDLSWTSKKNNGGSINASVNSETGDIMSYNSWEPNTNQTQTKIPKYSKDKAYDAAMAFIKKVAPTKANQVVLRDAQNRVYDMPIYSDGYSFNFIRQVNGLDFQDNGVTITVDKNTLKVKNFNMNWDNGTFTDPAKAISLDEAKKVFSSKLGIELSYNIIYDYKTKTQKPILVYTLKNGSNPIDAVTGELLNNDYRVFYNTSAVKAAADKGASGLTPEEQRSVDASDKYISKDNALAEAKKYVTVDDSIKLTGSNLYVNDFDNSASWSFYWEKNDTAKQTYSYTSATVDAITGKIRSFSMNGTDQYPTDKDVKPTYTKEAAKEIADKLVNSLEPDKFKLTVVKDTPEQILPKQDRITDYTFNYVAMINGATCNFDSFNVSVNAYSGKVMNYSMSWNNIDLPKADEAMKLEDAYKALYNGAKLNLKYIKIYHYDGVTAGTTEIKLAYVLDDFSGMFDAKSGTFLDYNGKPIVASSKSNGFTDIKGNSAENDINLLRDMGIIDSNSDKFDPNGQILQKDFIKMLVKSLGPDYGVYATSEDNSDDVYNSYYDVAIQRKIITEAQKKPDAKVTRQEAAKLLVRSMGIGYLGEAGSIFNLNLKDAKQIPNDLKGYVAIATGLNIISPIKGSYNGAKTLTRGETATIIVNYLKVDTNK